MSIMKTTLPVLLAAAILITLHSGCTKSGTSPDPGTGTGNTDPATLIQGKWFVVKDSIVVNNFAFSDGSIPIPGVYIGNANDYWLFQTNGTVYIYEGAAVGTTPFQLLSATRLLIPAFQWGDITITTLTSTNFTWEKIMTNSNGGTYYRRAYLKK